MENKFVTNKRCFVTYTISYCVEVDLDLPSDIKIGLDGITNESDIFRINQANLEVIDNLDTLSEQSYVDNSFEVTNIMWKL